MRARSTLFVLPLLAFFPACPFPGQQTEATPPPASPATTQSAPTTPLVWKSTTVPAKDAKPDKPVKAEKEAKPEKPKKAVYDGPTETIVLAPAPMLDEEGRQRLDPDGKPMFNPPVSQQRDKYGHPLFDDKKKPVFQTATELGYDEHGKKIHVAKEKPPKMVPVHIDRGTFTVDGVVGKAALNYDIADLKYFYMYVPGIGIAVVSNAPFPGAKEEKNAFNEKSLNVTVGEHKLEIASEKPLLGKKPESAFVRVDRDFSLPSRFPVVGYGTLRVAPYAWPGAKPNEALAGVVDAPPLPPNLRPVQLLMPCPKGQMRMVAKALPGQSAPLQPCVAIPAAAGKSAMTASAPASAAVKQEAAAGK